MICKYSFDFILSLIVQLYVIIIILLNFLLFEPDSSCVGMGCAGSHASGLFAVRWESNLYAIRDFSKSDPNPGLGSLT